MGMTLLRDSPLSYVYIGPDRKVYNRIAFQKHKLKNILENYNEKETEIQNMTNNGYRQMFDCGEHVFIKLYNQG